MPPIVTVRDRSLRLKRKSSTPVWLSLVWRVTLALALIGIVLAVHWIDRDGLRDTLDGQVSFTDVLYFTMITVASVGYGDIVPVTDQTRMFDTFVVTPVRLFLWLIFLGTAYDFVLKGVWERWRMSIIQRHLRHHTVVAGYGSSGSEAVNELLRRAARSRPDRRDRAARRRIARRAGARGRGDRRRRDPQRHAHRRQADPRQRADRRGGAGRYLDPDRADRPPPGARRADQCRDPVGGQ